MMEEKNIAIILGILMIISMTSITQAYSETTQVDSEGNLVINYGKYIVIGLVVIAILLVFLIILALIIIDKSR